MIQELRIQNLALLREIALEFGPGFIAVTGETGAGKSVLLGALNLLSGGRAEKSVIRAGAETCAVEGVIALGDAGPIDACLAELGLPACEEGALVLSRTISRHKAPRVRINGQLATVGNLQALGALWIDFHGPGEPQKLLHEAYQLELLDASARHGTLLEGYRMPYLDWQAKRQERDRLRESQKLSDDEAEFLRSQIEQIDGLRLSEEAVAELEAHYRHLTHGLERREKGSVLADLMAGDDGVIARMSSGLAVARELGRLDPAQLELADRLESILLESEDLAAAFEDLAEEGAMDPESAMEVEARMEAWLSVQRKYGKSVGAVLARREEMAQRLASQGDLEGTLARIEREISALEAAMGDAGEKLRASRVRAAHRLAKDALELLRVLGFKKPRLEIEILRDRGFRERGDSSCRFVFAPNPGVEPMPLGKIASSGEIARVMLALKAVLARVDATPVLVFDEVDANVGGETAKVVGRELAGLGAVGHQVFCITHLPQVAATASTHFVVTKELRENATEVEITRVDRSPEARVDELSRMLGDRSSASARQHAEELLSH